MEWEGFLRRIVLLVSNMNMGGAERVAATLCNAWTERGDRVTLIATFSGRGECYYEISPSVRLVFLSNIVKGRGTSPIGYIRRLWALRQLIKGSRPDVVVSFLSNVNIAAIAATRG